MSERATPIDVPALYTSSIRIGGNESRQLLHAEQAGVVGRGWIDLADGGRYPIGQADAPHCDTVTRLLVSTDADGAPIADRWLGAEETADPAVIRASMADLPPITTRRRGMGLRQPQLGAVYAVMAHHTTNDREAVTVVLPTGTGKTDVMVTLFAVFRPRSLLVLVPTDALRTQIGRKFESFGLLRDFGLIAADVMNPVVCLLRHGITDPNGARRLVRTTNVIVATPHVLQQFSTEALAAFTEGTDTLYVDEAHHVPATTWSRIRDDFDPRRVVQFTATPYRNDGKRLGGRIIYSYPLAEAKREGYFADIRYQSVFDLQNADRCVAEAAVAQLRQDLAAGLDHILFARTNTQARASELVEVYRDLAPDLSPRPVHGGVPTADRMDTVRELDATPRTCRIIVCVDMLGEGFDLPQLKVAALHDPHKSLGVTLQFIGRFARTNDDHLGTATVVAMRPDRLVDRQLIELYSQNSDWNHLIAVINTDATEEERARDAFEDGFVGGAEGMSLQALRPGLRADIFDVPGTEPWRPDQLTDAFPSTAVTLPPAINADAAVVWTISTQNRAVDWVEGRALEQTAVDLHLVHFDENRRLLYVQSSASGWVDRIAAALTGGDAERIKGDVMFRVMGGLDRPIPLNMGLLDLHSRNSRYVGFMGADVSEGLSEAEQANKSQTHMYVSGFRNGEWDGIGASASGGRIWRSGDASVDQWRRWVSHSGRRVRDTTINLEELLRSFIRPVALDTRPDLIPLAIEWPWQVVATGAAGISLRDDAGTVPMAEAELVVTRHERDGPISFDLQMLDRRHGYEVVIDGRGMTVAASDTDVVTVTSGRIETPFTEYASATDLLLLCEDNAVVTSAGLLLRPNRNLPPFPIDRLTCLDWRDADLSDESMGHGTEGAPLEGLRRNTVQGQMFEVLAADDSWDVIVNDDGTGEVADLVAISVANDALRILLVHCKFAPGGVVGRRVKDLYEVCGQASKSTELFRDPAVLIEKLLTRERNRRQRRGESGLLRGSDANLYDLKSRAPMLRREFTVAIAQPGLRSDRPSTAQLALLASTDDYIHTKSQHGLLVYCS